MIQLGNEGALLYHQKRAGDNDVSERENVELVSYFWKKPTWSRIILFTQFLDAEQQDPIKQNMIWLLIIISRMESYDGTQHSGEIIN